MQVVKRDGSLEDVHFDKISSRLQILCDKTPRLRAIDVPRIAQHACTALHDRIKTETLDTITADAAAALATEHPDYSSLAARILVSNLHKTTSADVVAAWSTTTVSREMLVLVSERADELNDMIDYDRDYRFDYFGFRTLQKGYLLPDERPQHMYLRVALGIWNDDLVRVKETYDALSTHVFTHASPTLFNAGTKTPQLCSCFLTGVHVDSLDDIFESFHKVASISKYGGGIGFNVSSVRSKGSLIRSTNGASDGLVPMLKVLNEVANYVNQCFVPETLVFSTKGAVRMDSVRIGDELLTQDGTYQRVNSVFVRDVVDETMITLTPEHGLGSITCTAVHEIFTHTGYRPAGDLLVGEYLGFPAATLRECENTRATCATLEEATERMVSCIGSGRVPRVSANGSSMMYTVTCEVPDVYDDKGLYTRIVDITRSPYTGKVYDFNMENNHSYTTVCGVVHNSGKRKGSIAVYIEPHHADILQVLDLKRNQGDEHLRARDLFYAMWVSDVFMERVEANAEWSLFDPGSAPGLEDCHGIAYRELYERYEAEGRAVATVPAQDVWFAILRSQIETGVPYMVYKDSANRKSNQQNLGTIKCSNLCSEIIEYTAEDEVAVCNLGSLSLPAFVVSGKNSFDYAALHAATKVLARNLDRVIDVTFYPIDEARRSNMRHRPIGIGVQGLADVFFALDIAFDSPEAAEINGKIFATIYHAAVETSWELACVYGPYETFSGSPASQGQLQFDLWDAVPDDMYDWDVLKFRIREDGMRNSLLIAPMPTASTAQIMGNTEAFEPITSNLYSRNTLAGSFVIVNKYLQRALLERGLWTPALKQKIVAADGSVQSIPEIPDDIKRVYKTAYELSMRTIIDMAADRGVYIDQSASLNLFVDSPTFRKLSSMHFYAWKKGLKTGMYYLRSKAASGAKKITVDSYAGNECVACSG